MLRMRPARDGRWLARRGLAVVAALALGYAVTVAPGNRLLPAAAGLGALGVLVLVAGRFVPRPHPGIGLAVLAAAIPLRSIAGGAISGANIGLTEPAALLALFWLVAYRRPGALPLPRMLVAPGLFLGFAAISAAWAIDSSQSFKELAKWGQAAIALFAAMDLARCPSDLKPVAVVAGVALAGEVVLATAQAALGLGPDSFRVGGLTRAYGTFEQPNPFAGYLVLQLPFALAGALIWNGKWRWLALGVAALAMVGIVLSLSRGAWLGGVVGMLVAGWLAAGMSRGLLKWAGLVVAIGLAFFLLSRGSGVVPATAGTILSGERDLVDLASNSGSADFAVMQRVAFWVAGARMVADRPLTGVGLGNFDEGYPDYNIGIWDESLGHAHNFYLNLAAEAGLISAGLFVVFLGGVMLRGLRAGGRAPASRVALIGATGSLTAFAAHSLVDSVFVGGLGLILGVAAGLILALSDRNGVAGRR
ncbi:MAG TPA: O-antigen ligase family protein [Chloroflexota bacterium]|nr:O-antigen ligase family protein [Chloroflexota bacterium]